MHTCVSAPRLDFVTFIVARLPATTEQLATCSVGTRMLSGVFGAEEKNSTYSSKLNAITPSPTLLIDVAIVRAPTIAIFQYLEYVAYTIRILWIEVFR